MQTVLIILHVFVCVFMILVILLQPSKEGGFGGMGGTSSSVFGGRGSATFLGKVTTVCAAIFMISSLTLAYLSSKSESAVLRIAEPVKEAPKEQPKEGAGAAAKAAPAVPAAPAAPAPAAPAAPAKPAAPAAPPGK